MAKELVGNFPNLRPDNPARFLESVAQVLGQYPPGIGQECCDPVTGIARKVEFLSLKSLADWCDARLSFHRALADYREPPARAQLEQLEPGPITAEQCENLMAKVGEVLRANVGKSPLDELIDQKAEARRLRHWEITRAAEE